jgi:drug/metabolite transporter (DMT)-like permease
MYKYIVPYISAESIILIAGIFYAILALLYIPFSARSNVMKDLQVMNKNKILYGWLLGTAILSLISTYFYLNILKDSSAFLVTAWLSVYPIITALVGYLFLNEAVSFTQLIGIVVIVIGIMILNLGDFDY